MRGSVTEDAPIVKKRVSIAEAWNCSAQHGEDEIVRLLAPTPSAAKTIWCSMSCTTIRAIFTAT